MLQHLGMCCEQLHPEEGLDVQEEVRVVHEDQEGLYDVHQDEVHVVQEEEGHVVQSLKNC